MRLLATLTLICSLAACSSGSEAGVTNAPRLTITQAESQTCAEVRAGIDDFNDGDYRGTVAHFTKAKATAKVYATISTEPEADALLDAVEYYSHLAPEDYPEAARSSEHFARNKAITLNQCASADDGDPSTQEV